MLNYFLVFYAGWFVAMRGIEMGKYLAPEIKFVNKLNPVINMCRPRRHYYVSGDQIKTYGYDFDIKIPIEHGLSRAAHVHPSIIEEYLKPPVQINKITVHRNKVLVTFHTKTFREFIEKRRELHGWLIDNICFADILTEVSVL